MGRHLGKDFALEVFADLFNVYALPAGPGTGRNLSIDGGAPSGPGNPKDNLNVYHDVQPPPPANHDKNNQTIDLVYELYEFHIDYVDFEQAKLLSINAAD